MTSKQTKRIAFLLAASLLMNTAALPVSAESDVAIVEEAPTEAPTEAPVEIVTEPPTEAPTAEAATEAPTEAATEAPTEEATEAPTEEATETPTEEATEAPTEEATEAPTEEATETPTEEATEAPTEEATEAPTEEPTEPLTREDILAAQQEGYQQALSHFRSMDISDDRTMSLEWWCVMTGNVSMREPDYSILDAQAETGAPQEEAAEKTWADYIVFSEVISVRSASDLILLSYVSPNLYQNRTVTLFADAGNEFDLVHPLSVTAERTLNYRGLGDLGSPFSGIIRYAENSENITFVLDAPLFIGLSTRAKFLNRLDQPNTVYLVSKAGFAFDGLLARHILGEQQDEANWFIQLNAPDFTGGAVYVLPSLLGVLYGNANVNLLLTDNSCLSPSPRGYLCATMYAQSSLSAAGITRKLSVPVVGELSPDATLATDAPGEEVTEPTEEVTEPTEETTEPTEETTEPTEETTEPTGEATEPSEEATEPTEEATEPTEEATEPTGEVTEPTGEATEPTREATEPTEEATEPTGEATEPTEEDTEPTEEATEPSEEATEPTEETTEPTEPAADDAPVFRVDMTDEEFQALVDYYLALPVVPGEMPLEWWFAVCGKLDDLRLYLTLKAEKEAASQPVVLPAPSDVPPVVDVPPISAETETPAPTGASVQNEPIAFALENGDDGTVFSAEEMPAAFDSTEETPVATEAAAETEAPTLPDVTEAAEATEPTEATEETEAPVNTEAEGDGADDTPSGDDTANVSPQAAVNLNIRTVDDLVKLSATKASDYQKETIIITADGGVINVTDTAFAGLGSDAFPFAGKIQYVSGSEAYLIVLNRALFNALSANADIANVNLTWAGTAAESNGAAILANTVYAGTSATVQNWKVILGKFDTADSQKVYCLPALIHTIRNGAAVTLSAVNNSAFPFAGQGFFCDNLEGTLIAAYPEKLPTFNTAKDNVGGIVGTMAAGAALTVNAGTTAIVIDVATGGSTAGGLVGRMESGATLNVTADSITVNQVTASIANDSNVGSLVGEAVDPVFNFSDTITGILAGAATESHGYHLNGYSVGGLVGKLTTSASGLKTLPVNGLTLRGINCGGLFGELDNSAAFSALDYAAEASLSAVTVNRYEPDNVSEGQPGSTIGNSTAGGLIGLYKPTASASLSISNISATVTAGDKSFHALGGLIGTAEASGNTYVAVSACKTRCSLPAVKAERLGGTVGKLTGSPVHLKVSGEVSFDTEKNNDCTGGIVGLAEDYGHLIEVDTFTLTAANLKGDNSGGLVGDMQSGVVYMNNVPTLNITDFDYGKTHGWIVGKRGNALVCAAPAITDWPVGANRADPKDNNDTGVWGQVLQLSQFDSDLVTLDSANHTVTLRAMPGADVASRTDFAAVALRVQLNPNGMLVFDNDFPDGAAVNLNLTGDIDLTNTGLTGLTRDCAVSETHSYSIQGNDHTITLPNIPIFASDAGHDYQGLIAQSSGSLKIDKLKVNGGSTVKCDGVALRCGIVAELKCPAEISNNTTSGINWTITGNAQGSNVSGFIGKISTSDSIAFTGCTWNGVMTNDSNADVLCVMGGYLGDSNGQTPAITVTNCTVSGTVQNTVKNADREAMVGGLFGRLWKCSTLTVNGLIVDKDAKVITLSQKNSGGLLGYELYCNTATFDNVNINGATLNTNAKFGGLIYKGAGYWKVNGITFQSAAITGITDDKTPSGLLVSVGCSGVESYGGLYLEVGDGAYQIDGTNVTVNLTSGTYFDELVGRSIQEDGSGKNGVVSIATENNAPIDTNGCNTYQKQLATDYSNPRTRYYYNLDKFCTDDLPGDTISTPAQMVLWSAYNECKNCTEDGTTKSSNSNLGKYFASGSSKRTITGNIDLTGYSFYPVAFDGTSIQNAAITFGFQQLEETESTAGNKKPSDSQRQHAGMHTGIFTEITAKYVTLTVDSLTLKGTVGSIDDRNTFGALVRDKVVGSPKQNEADTGAKDTDLNISNITLDGIRVYPTPDNKTVAPLLINTIGNYVSLRLTDVETTSRYVTENIPTAASSLIGKVGSTGAISIDLEFSRIRLTPPANEADETSKRNNCTLFTRALFLESFQHTTGCRGVYNFTRDEKYTIGQEVSNTDSGRNQEKQYWFFNEWDYAEYNGLVCDATGTLTARQEDAATAYQKFTRYVFQEEPGADNYKELDVNLQPLDLTDGCGTYSDPYRIKDGDVLREVARALENGGSNPSWKVRISTKVLPDNPGDPAFSRDDGHTYEKVRDGEELVLVCGEKDWNIADDSTGTVRATQAQMLNYLRNAYYMIENDITLPSDWTGLGTYTVPFRGVIVGGASKPTVEITAPRSQQFGGLIKFSQGSVVKNLKIQCPAAFEITSGDANILDYQTAVFFGGAVGCCNAGDTIIDDVEITPPKTLKISGKNEPVAAIGGYVGLVGGANSQGGGGVVFRGSVSSSWQPNGNLYTNPYVGRVLDGYAVSEISETKIDNGDKNYRVPTLTSPILEFNDGTVPVTVTVGNGDGLWLLSAMENSRHGGAYTNGKPRTHEYGTVGEKMPDDVKNDESGSGRQTNYYLWKHYDIKGLMPTSFKLVFSGDCNMERFGNGFRGIGVSQGTFRAYLQDPNAYPLITEIDGGRWTVTLAQNRTEPKGQYVDWAAMGTGLFPILNAGADLYIHDLTLNGTATLTVGDVISSDSHTIFHPGYQRTMVGAGLLAGALVSKVGTRTAVELTKVHTSGTVSTNAPLAGGLIGYCGSPVTKIPSASPAFSKLTSISITDCSVSGNVTGSSSIGGFIGYTFADEVTIRNCTGTNVTLSAGNYWNNSFMCGNYPSSDKSGRSGIGGMIGSASQTKLRVTKATMSGLSISIAPGGIAKKSPKDNDVGLGGIVGTLRASGESVWENISIDGCTILDSTDCKTSVGSLIGLLSGTTSGDKTIAISDVTIGATSAITLQGFQVGGLIGTTDKQEAGSITLNIGTTEKSVTIGHAPNDDEGTPVSISANGRSTPSLSGLIGVTDNTPKITIQNLVLSGITVEKETVGKATVGTAGYNSLILAQNSGTDIFLTLKNAEIISCELKKQDDAATGFLLGGTPAEKATTFNGFNILLKKCKTDASGIFAGTIAGTGSSMNLVAVSVVDGTGGTKDFFSGNGYVIRSDYTGAQTYQLTGSKPWVDVNPLSNLNDKVIGVSPVTGDGTAFMEGGKTPIGTKIATEKKYYNVTSAAEYFQDAGKASTLGISLAPFSTAGGNTGTNMPDFPVLVLPAVSKAEVNTAVYNYISLLTNFNSSAETLSGKLEGAITATTYQWKDTQFEAITDSSITVNDGTIYTTPGKYDNTLNQFTLLTVSFKDPTDAGNSYKLYIPIVVQKLLNYHFYASAISGTLYSRGTYETMESPVVTTHGDQVTVLLSYVYDNGKTGDAAIEEWQNTVNNGDNLLWNFDKTITLGFDGSEVLPAGAKLTLVDRNNRDKVYYTTYDGKTYDGKGIIPLNSFTDAARQGYVKNALCDAMGLKAEAADDGLFVQETDTAKATVRILENGKYVYYRLAAEGETAQKYSITVGSDTLWEEYYLTIQTPADSTNLSNVTIQCESSLKNGTGDKTMLPNKFIEADSQHPYTRNNAENRILFGNFFEQKVTVTTATAEEISDVNNTINATLTVSIDYKSDAWKELFGPYAGAVKLYQRFELQASDWTGGTSTSTSFTKRTATIRYLNGTTTVGSEKATELGAEGIMVLKFPESVTVSTNTGLNAATLVAEVSLAYTPAQIQAQFDTRSNNTDGLQLWANSYLAYSQAALERSNNPTRGDDAKHFYRTKSTPATLVYNANGTDMDARVNQLGVNGRVQDAASIDSVATYSVAALEAAKNADTIRYAITLYRKDDSGNFVQVDASNLLTVGDITATLADRNGTEQTVEFGEKFTGGIDNTVPIRISLPLTVATGNGFTGTYANYQVELRVWLQNGDAQITGSEATDYIIYTNAKIKFPLVTSD